MIDKNKALSTYIKTYPQLYGWLYFNVINMAETNMSLVMDADNIVSEFIDGAKIREYIFQISMIKPFDTGTSEINIDALKETQNFNAWIKSQNEARNFPIWNSTDIIDSIESLTEIPTMEVDSEKNLAKYTIQVKINYLEIKE